MLGSRLGGAGSTAAPCRALGDTMRMDCPQPDASIIAVLWLLEGSPRAGMGCSGLRGAFPLRTSSLWLAQKPVPLSEPNSLRILPFPLQALLAATLPGAVGPPGPAQVPGSSFAGCQMCPDQGPWNNVYSGGAESH